VGLLEFLEQERAESSIRTFAESEGFDADEQIAFLDERGLVWREGERMMSLVMLGESDA
jgi:hypothetical protein